MQSKGRYLRAAASAAALAMALSLGSSAVQAEPFAAAAQGSQGAMGAQDAAFLKHAIMNDHAAIDAGNLGLKKSSNEQLKQVAQTVVDTHTKMLSQLEEQAGSAGVKAPSGAGNKAKSMCGTLARLHGKSFENEFVRDLIKLHEQEQKAFQAEATGGKSEPLMKISQDQLPIIQQHLTDLKGIQENDLKKKPGA